MSAKYIARNHSTMYVFCTETPERSVPTTASSPTTCNGTHAQAFFGFPRGMPFAQLSETCSTGVPKDKQDTVGAGLCETDAG